MNYSYRSGIAITTLVTSRFGNDIIPEIKIHFVWCVGFWCGVVWCAYGFCCSKDNSLASLFVENTAQAHTLTHTKHMSAAALKVSSFVLQIATQHTIAYENVQSLRWALCAGRFLRRRKLLEFSLGRFTPPSSISFTFSSFLAGFFRYIPPPLCRRCLP